MSMLTVEIVFHSAHNLPIGDLNSLSSDPYIKAELIVPSRPLEPDDPPVTYRTPTIRRSRQPIWTPQSAMKAQRDHEDAPPGQNDTAAVWVVNVPSDGFILNMVIMDEDPGNTDDRLGRSMASFRYLAEDFEDLEMRHKIKKRKGRMHIFFFTKLASMFPSMRVDNEAYLVMSVRVLGKSADQNDDRVYTVGPNKWSQHYSPLIGRITPKTHARAAMGKEDAIDAKAAAKCGDALTSSDFIANKIQLTGPVPRELRHRYVGYASFIESLFTNRGIRGRLLSMALHKQHRGVYSYDKRTRYGVCRDRSNGGDGTNKDAAALDFAREFLRMTNHGAGGRMFTYVITLDAEWRFTETGAEFAIDLLSKHSMHADVAKEVAFSGEFFVRRLGKGRRFDGGVSKLGEDAERKGLPEDLNEEEKIEEEDLEQGANSSEEDIDPRLYELVIDNDSGTYRPHKELLPLLRDWLADENRLGALGRVTAVDGFDEGLKAEKQERQEGRKAQKGIKGKKGDKGKDAQTDGPEPGKMMLARKGSSISSIGSGRLRRSSVSSDEVKAIIREREQEKPKESRSYGQHVNGHANGYAANEV